MRIEALVPYVPSFFGGVATGGVVFAIAKRALSENSRYFPLALGVVAGSLVGYFLSRRVTQDLRATQDLQSLQPSSAIEKKDIAKARSIIQLFARNEIILSQLKIPGIVEVIKRLLSGNIQDVRTCELFLYEHDIAGIQMGTDATWILPRVAVERSMIQLRDGSDVVTFNTDKEGCRQVLKKLRIEETEARPYRNVSHLELRLSETVVSEVELLNKDHQKIGESIKVKEGSRCAVTYVKGLKRLPTPSEGYTDVQRAIANILINTIWLDDKFASERDGLEHVVTGDFSEVIFTLERLVFSERGNIQLGYGYDPLRSGINVDFTKTNNLAQLFTYTLNGNNPNNAVFDLGAIRMWALATGIQLIMGENLIYASQKTVSRFVVKVAEMLAAKQVIDYSKNALSVPPDLVHDSRNSDETYVRNWRGVGLRNEQLVMNGTDRDINLTSILSGLPEPETIICVFLQRTEVTFNLKSSRSATFELPIPDQGNTKFYCANLPQWSPH